MGKMIRNEPPYSRPRGKKYLHIHFLWVHQASISQKVRKELLWSMTINSIRGPNLGSNNAGQNQRVRVSTPNKECGAYWLALGKILTGTQTLHRSIAHGWTRRKRIRIFFFGRGRGQFFFLGGGGRWA